jgi:hypothetical protein
MLICFRLDDGFDVRQPFYLNLDVPDCRIVIVEIAAIQVELIDAPGLRNGIHSLLDVGTGV